MDFERTKGTYSVYLNSFEIIAYYIIGVQTGLLKRGFFCTIVNAVYLQIGNSSGGTASISPFEPGVANIEAGQDVSSE